MKRLLSVFTGVAFCFAASGLMLAQSDAFAGTWKLNVAKSNFNQGPPIKSDMRTYEPTGDGYKVTSERVTGDGSRLAYGINYKFDGKDYPITGQGPYGADAISVKRVDANATDSTLKKGGKVIFTTRSEVSKDARTLTLSSKGTDATGQPLNVVLVFDKQ